MFTFSQMKQVILAVLKCLIFISGKKKEKEKEKKEKKEKDHKSKQKKKKKKKKKSKQHGKFNLHFFYISKTTQCISGIRC